MGFDITFVFILCYIDLNKSKVSLVLLCSVPESLFGNSQNIEKSEKINTYSVLYNSC